MRTTISISLPLLAQARKQASERRVTLSAVIEIALRDHFSKEPRVAAQAAHASPADGAPDCTDEG